MDNYDQDLIFDLAAGALPAEEARAAEAALSPAGRAELEAQRAVLAAVSSEPPAPMTDLERARLHRGVAAGMADATRELPVVAAARPARRPRSVLWMRVATAAGAAAVLAGVVAVGSQLTGGNDGDASADAPLRVATTAAAGGSATALSSTTAPALESADGGAEFDSAGDASTESSGADLAGLEEAPALSAPPDEADLASLADFASGMITAQRNMTGRLSTLPCYDVATEDDDLAVADSFLVPYPGEDGAERFAIAYSDGGTSETKPLVLLYDPSTCERLGDGDTAP